MSVKSALMFLFTNLYMGLGGCIESIIMGEIIKWDYSVVPVYGILLARNYSIMSIITYGTRYKEYINKNNLPMESYKGEFIFNFLQATFVEVLTLMLIQKYYFNLFVPINNPLYEFLWFIPLSFMFEIIFDFFHYWAHRLIHENKGLYKLLHKKHHKFPHPIPIITYYQEPLDLILTNSIPTILTLYLMPSLTYYQYTMIILYKTYMEISGHVGKRLYPLGSFTQCIFLPKFLGIQLYAEDHDAHHSKNNCNYGKRFSLWDKIFNTYYFNG